MLTLELMRLSKLIIAKFKTFGNLLASVRLRDYVCRKI
jgi:hypothetical protein